MAEQKPYTVYKGGRARGKVPLQRRGAAPSRDGKREAPYRGPGPKPPSRRRWRRWIALGLVVLLGLIVTWAVASYLAVRSGVKEANARLGRPARAALVPQDGLLLSEATSVLLIGTDSAPTPERRGLRHSDSMMLVTTDPEHNRISYLSIPRDLRVQVPDHGFDKINVAYQIGGPRLAVRTVRSYTGLPVNHLVIVDFARFEELIDALGGVTVDVPKPVLSNRFDCPYRAEQCSNWEGWRFEKGRHELDGHRALIYSRIRENRLDRADNDLSRAERQQDVLEAITHELTAVGTLVRLPWVGDDLMKPLATDLSTGELIQLGWRRFRSGSDRALHCRLGGEPVSFGGVSYIAPDEVASRRVIATVRGDSAPQPPPPENPLYGSGCVEGDRRLGGR
jgi:polyisoprenyl-teichoic acid--peptidoglycan teichoic acid transferase